MFEYVSKVKEIVSLIMLAIQLVESVYGKKSGKLKKKLVEEMISEEINKSNGNGSLEPLKNGLGNMIDQFAGIMFPKNKE